MFRRSKCDTDDESMASFRHSINNSMDGTTAVPATSSDPRLGYGDLLIQAINCIDEKSIFATLEGVMEPDVVWITTWMNQVKFEHKKCREMHGLACASSYMSNLISSSPDIIFYIKEKVLYKKPDNSSFLLLKLTCTGSLFWTVIMNNAMSAGRRLFSRNGFFGRIFRFDLQRQQGRQDESVDSSDRTHVSTARSEVDSPLDTRLTLSNNTNTTTSNNNNSSSSSNHHSNPNRTQLMRVREDCLLHEEIVDVSSQDEYPLPSFVQQQETSRKRKKAPRQQSMMHRNFLNFRKQKILPNEVEVGVEGASFELLRAKRPGSYIVSVTFVCHINPEQRIFKVESFKHLDWRQFFRWYSRYYLVDPKIVA